jgi:hypothetical protein
MKSVLITLVVIIVLASGGYAGWFYLIKKSPEGGTCTSQNRCEEGLKCINKTCSSGKTGSACAQTTDCTSKHCVNSTCTEGKKGDTCATYKDCDKNLFCKKSACSEPPSYSQYFDKISIGKIKQGTPPGPNNPIIPASEFKNTDAIEVDFVGVKPTTNGAIYGEVVDQTTGEIILSNSSDNQKLEGQNRGFGMGLPSATPAGEYDLNVYYNNELILATQIKVTN